MLDSPKLEKHRTKRAQGATPTPAESARAPRKWGRVVVVFGVCALAIFGGSRVHWDSLISRAYESTNRPLANIKIESEFRFVDQAQLQSIISSRLDGRFVDIDLGAVKAALEKNPWIASVTIERLWPDSLRLFVDEHRPIARWNDNGFINRAGDLIHVDSNARLHKLPLLTGDDHNSWEVAENYVFFAQLMSGSGLQVVGLRTDDRQSWTLDFYEGFSLILGRENIQDRLKNFKYVYDAHLGHKQHEIVRVDMRYEQGMAVEWENDSEFVATGGGQ